MEIVGGDGISILSGKGRVISQSGADITDAFIKGANQVLDIAARQGIRKVFLKNRSPSCGVGEIFGVTAALLLLHGYDLEEF